MEAQLISLEDNIQNFNKVKNLIVAKIVEEGYMSEEEGEEFVDRCQVMLYKGTWFTNWFKNNMQEKDEKGWYFKIIEMHDKETNLDDIIRRTAQGK